MSGRAASAAAKTRSIVSIHHYGKNGLDLLRG